MPTAIRPNSTRNTERHIPLHGRIPYHVRTDRWSRTSPTAAEPLRRRILVIPAPAGDIGISHTPASVGYAKDSLPISWHRSRRAQTGRHVGVRLGSIADCGFLARKRNPHSEIRNEIPHAANPGTNKTLAFRTRKNPIRQVHTGSHFFRCAPT